MKPTEAVLQRLLALPMWSILRYGVTGLLGMSLAMPAQAQDLRGAQASRAELQATLTELQQYMASSGYSARLRDQKRREADLIRSRLEDGDLQVGDSLEVT